MIQRSLLRQSQAVCQKYRPQSSLLFHRAQFPPIRIASLQQKVSAKCYSTTGADIHASSEASPADSSPPNPSTAAEDTELDTKNREIIDLKDKYLRSVAEFRNLQDRTKRDIDAARSFAISRFAADLMESVDNLDRALATVPVDKIGQADSNKDLVNLHDGLKMTETILMQTLRKHGLERFDPSESSEQFNPNLHEATFQTQVEGKPDGSVFTTIQKGFTLNGRVVRAAKVGVVKNS